MSKANELGSGTAGVIVNVPVVDASSVSINNTSDPMKLILSKAASAPSTSPPNDSKFPKRANNKLLFATIDATKVSSSTVNVKLNSPAPNEQTAQVLFVVREPLPVSPPGRLP